MFYLESKIVSIFLQSSAVAVMFTTKVCTRTVLMCNWYRMGNRLIKKPTVINLLIWLTVVCWLFRVSLERLESAGRLEKRGNRWAIEVHYFLKIMCFKMFMLILSNNVPVLTVWSFVYISKLCSSVCSLQGRQGASGPQGPPGERGPNVRYNEWSQFN